MPDSPTPLGPPPDDAPATERTRGPDVVLAAAAMAVLVLVLAVLLVRAAVNPVVYKADAGGRSITGFASLEAMRAYDEALNAFLAANSISVRSSDGDPYRLYPEAMFQGVIDSLARAHPGGAIEVTPYDLMYMRWRPSNLSGGIREVYVESYERIGEPDSKVRAFVYADDIRSDGRFSSSTWKRLKYGSH